MRQRYAGCSDRLLTGTGLFRGVARIMGMTQYEVSFEIDSKSDAAAVRRLLAEIHDTMREELRRVRAGSADASEVLQAFETLREAAEQPAPGQLTIIYERYDDGFET